MSKAERQAERMVAKATPEGVAVGVALESLSPARLAVQAAIAVALREALISVPLPVVAVGAVVVWVGTVVTGALYERYVLEKTGVVANPVTTTTYLATKNATWSVIVGNLYGQGSFFASPLDMGISAASLASDGGFLLLTNLLSRSINGLLFYSGFNLALEKGHAEKLVAKIRQLRLRVAGPVQDQLDRLLTFLEKSMGTASLMSEYQEGNISHQEMLGSLSAFNQEIT